MIFTGKLIFDGMLVSYVVNGISLEVENLTDSSSLTDGDLETVHNHVNEMHGIYTLTARELSHGIN